LPKGNSKTSGKIQVKSPIDLLNLKEEAKKSLQVDPQTLSTDSSPKEPGAAIQPPLFHSKIQTTHMRMSDQQNKTPFYSRQIHAEESKIT
jgi:hypothetical protein